MSESLIQKYDRILSMCEVGKKHGSYTQIRCPVTSAHKHEDREKSASLGLHNNGISFKCFAGCQTDDFLQALGLTYKDLFPDSENIPTNIYTYHNDDGSYHHDKLKYRDSQGKKTFKQRTIDENGGVLWKATVGVPFQYPDLIQAIKDNKLVAMVEGEKDCITAKILGYESTTLGGASDWKDEYKKYFKDANLLLIPDKDDAGLKLVGNMIDSLKTVAKSLKTMILPFGKDLTEWVEAGNFDLRPLIENTAIEQISQDSVPEPVVKVIVGGYELYWIGLNLKAVVDHIENDDSVELAIYENEKPIYISGYKLLSISHKESLSRALGKLKSGLKWEIIVNQITVQCLSRIRNGESVVYISDQRVIDKPKYLIEPLFVENNVNIIYGDRSSAKSLFMTFIDLMFYFEWEYNPFGLSLSGKHTALFLDWENDSNVTSWQTKCLALGVEVESFSLPYLHCSKPLIKCLSHIQQKINEVGADVIIIDSLGVAVGGNLNDTEPALNFFSALRQLPVTPLIIAHNAKDMNNKIKTVYGNAFYENLSRSIWEVVKTQGINSPELVLTLHHRKSPPFSSYHRPLGFKFKFDADRTVVSLCEAQEDKRDS
jgi:hypothetical protein